jgi:hypothetical protein
MIPFILWSQVYIILLFSKLSVQEMDEDPLNDQMIQTTPSKSDLPSSICDLN